MRIYFVALLLLSIIGCTERDEVTDSQIRFTTAMNEHKRIVAKANSYLDKNLADNIERNITHLIYAKELAYHAEKVLKSAKIIGVHTVEMRALDKRLSNYDREALILAVDLLNTSLNKTIEFKQTVREMPMAPLSGVSLNSKSMIGFMGDEYNSELAECCLTTLKDIDILLRGRNDDIAWAIRKKILNVEKHLSLILTDDEYQDVYSTQLATLVETLKVNK